MYKIYCDGEILYHPNIEEMDIVSGEIDKEANVADSFSFSLMASHPFINKINRMKSVIEVKKGKKIIFRGRDACEDGDFYNTCEFICEGAYAYFNDTVIMPFEFSGRPDELLAKLVEEHNAQVGEEKKFIVGECTVTDPNDYIVRSSEKAMQTIDCIKEKLTESSLGGYIRIRYEAEGNYIDYIDDGNILCNQAIEFGKNLIDLNRTSMYTDIVTSVVPYGAEDENGKNIDVSSVNNGSLVVDDEELIEKYGLIRRLMYWDDVTQPENLLEKTKQFLKGMDYNQDHVVFNALDLSHIDKSVNEFDIYDYVPVKSKPHGIVKNAFCSGQHIDIKDPGQDYMEVGLNIESSRRQQTEKFKEIAQIVERVEKVESNAKINEGAIEDLREDTNSTIIALREEVGSQITQSAESVKSSVYDNVYVKDEVDSLVSSVSTEVEQTKDSWQVIFNQFQADVNDIASGNDAKFEEIKKYIRFEDGNILLGNSESPLVLKIQNDRISFLQNGYEVAYISDRKMYNTVCSVIDRLEIGDSAWQVEYNEDGNTVVSLVEV